jgi:hypothetical protein
MTMPGSVRGVEQPSHAPAFPSRIVVMLCSSQQIRDPAKTSWGCAKPSMTRLSTSISVGAYGQPKCTGIAPTELAKWGSQDEVISLKTTAKLHGHDTAYRRCTVLVCSIAEICGWIVSAVRNQSFSSFKLPALRNLCNINRYHEPWKFLVSAASLHPRRTTEAARIQLYVRSGKC